MKLGVIADIHANKPALDAVLDDLAAHSIDALVCLGDIVGLLGSPNAVVTTIRDESTYTVYGNHDARLFPEQSFIPQTGEEVAEFNHVTEDLTTANVDWLTTLPGYIEAPDDVLIAHSRPDPAAPEGGLKYDDAGVHPRDFVGLGATYLGTDGGTILIGHTHYQHAVALGKFDGVDGLVLNPGSVGYPYDSTATRKWRDGRPTASPSPNPIGDASYAVVETQDYAYELCSVEYDATPIKQHLETLDLG